MSDLRAYYATKFDFEDLGVVAKADAVVGWKCFSVTDGGYSPNHRSLAAPPRYSGTCSPHRLR